MDAGAHERAGATPVRLVLTVRAAVVRKTASMARDPSVLNAALRWRLPLLAAGFICLVLGVSGGLARLEAFVPSIPSAIIWHGTLMVSGFFGTVISLERAVALNKGWGYIAPLASGAGGILLAAGLTLQGLALMVLGAAGLAAASALIASRHASLETGTLAAGSVAWLAGNTLLVFGGDPVPWWIAFFALTIAGERLELSRYLRHGRLSRSLFTIIAAAMLPAALSMPVLGAMLVMLSLWLLACDLALVTVRTRALARYVAVCLLAGYFWLAAGGLALAGQVSRDAALHALFLGFVFSMILGHAPVILPAVLRVSLPYSAALYGPLGLLHASVAVRIAGDLSGMPSWVAAGAWGNAAAIALFIISAAALVFRGRYRAAHRAVSLHREPARDA